MGYPRRSRVLPDGHKVLMSTSPKTQVFWVYNAGHRRGDYDGTRTHILTNPRYFLNHSDLAAPNTLLELLTEVQKRQRKW